MSGGGGKKTGAKLSKRLVLNGWMLDLFGVADAIALLEDMATALDPGDPAAAWLGSDGVTLFHRRLTSHTERPALTHIDLLRYDENIVRHWRDLTIRPERRNMALKHFQYAALLFTEVYLDRYFEDADRLLSELNTFREQWNEVREQQDWAEEFARGDLNKLAFWMATGSGKTLLMHANIKQYLHYLGADGKRRELNRIILLTPNDGLSRQHLDEFAASGMYAQPFAKERRTLFASNAIEVIDIHKLAEQSKDKTVAVDAFEGNNLVLVDEGHRGASASEAGAWMDRRRRLCEGGFSFEYSATFGQAIKPGGSKALLQEYSRAILFDYSYRYFHADGFGKEFHVLNLEDDRDDEQRSLYLTGGLLAFLQQLYLYHTHRHELDPYLIDKPLWVFVGSRVTASTGNQELSDIQQIIDFLDDFLRNRDDAISRIENIRTGNNSLIDRSGQNIFLNRLTPLTAGRTSEEIYDEALRRIFNAPEGGALHLERLRGAHAEGEISLGVGSYDSFGVINVGDSSKVVRQAMSDGIIVTQTGEFKDSLFRSINYGESAINILIGAKKFTEGWSSWRVSTIGLMNVGKSEGSEIIQLFGRGVRLRGLDFSLRRSGFVCRGDGQPHPRYLRQLETLNVVGIHAQYMQQFREFLEEEGLPDETGFHEIKLDVINHLAEGGRFEGVRLLTIRLDSGVDFRTTGPRLVLEAEPHEQIIGHPVTLDWYPRIEAHSSANVDVNGGGTSEKLARPLTAAHTAFFNFNEIWIALQRFKAEKLLDNLVIPRGAARELLRCHDWYRLLIPSNELDFSDFDRVQVWQKIAIAALKKYVERYYHLRQAEYEMNHLHYGELQPDDGNFFEHYTLHVPSDQSDVRAAVGELQGRVAQGEICDLTMGSLQALAFDRHLYVPLVHLSGGTVKATPVALNAGERAFVEHLERFIDTHASDLGAREVYLLRNQSRGRGIGFFEAGGYYPDFILWVKENDRQHIAFVDPKGLNYLDGLTDPKIGLAKSIKEHEKRLGAHGKLVELDAFVVSETPFHQLRWAHGLTRETLEEHHVLFPESGSTNHIRRMFELMGELMATG